jgi:transcription initiation factor TFIIB
MDTIKLQSQLFTHNGSKANKGTKANNGTKINNGTTKATGSKTKKIKKNNIDKKSLWSKFDSNINQNLDEFGDPTNTPESQIECVFLKTENKENCNCCEYPLFMSDEGFLACTNNKCGVIYKVIDQSAEWRFYGADDNSSDDPTRCGMPINPLLEQSSYGCKVVCPSKTSYEMRKIRRYTEWQSMPYNEKMRYDEGLRINALANEGGIPKIIIDDAMRLHKRLSEAKSFRGLNRDGIIAATIYVAARINDYPRSVKEIANIFHLDVTSATKGCKNALEIINNLEKDMDNKEKTNFGRTKPEAFIERFCSKLNINNELTKLCKFISMKIEKNNIMPENTPHSIAAGIVYFICQICSLNINKRDIKNVSEISEVTINKCFKKMEKIQNDLIPAAILKKYTTSLVVV